MGSKVAIVGMACRFPGAETPEQFWLNLRDGVESIRRASREELIAQGLAPETIDNPAFVPAGSLLSGIDCFDADLFGFTPREAEILDPQHRIFLECAWEALERAGIDPSRYPGSVGVFAGAGVNLYAVNNLNYLYGSGAGFEVMLGNDKDFLAARAAYKLNLKGPAISLQTACSTSLVAVHVACQSLLAGECDVALAGGSSIRVPHAVGYIYQPGMIASSDGHCRPFDTRAGGTVPGNGVGVVVLKRIEETQRDSVFSVIAGTAVNNDGALKAGFTAPSAAGQAAVIREALAVAGLSPQDISYVEAHGTATPLGDPIEVEGLNEVFGKSGACTLGSVKSNVGHLDTAAGAAGLIKTVLALQHRTLPPTLHFSQPNPEIPFEEGPFKVNAALSPWKSDTPLYAGVSSFGIGGTNAHVIVGEAPAPERISGKHRPLQLLTVSAHTSEALKRLCRELAGTLESSPDLFEDACYTMSSGRKELAWRTFVVAGNAKEAVQALRSVGSRSHQKASLAPMVAFRLSEMGSDCGEIARVLAEVEPAFRSAFERAELATIRTVQNSTAFSSGYAFAVLLMGWGIRPECLIGSGIGKDVSSALSEAFKIRNVFPEQASGFLGIAVQIGSPLDMDASDGSVVQTLPFVLSRTQLISSLLNAVGRLWQLGVPVDWEAFYAERPVRRICLPTYPFERRRYWIEPSAEKRFKMNQGAPRNGMDDWFYLPIWRVLAPVEKYKAEPATWLLLGDGAGVREHLSVLLKERGDRVVQADLSDYKPVLGGLSQTADPLHIVHLASLKADIEDCFFGPLGLLQALAEGRPKCRVRISIVTAGMQPVNGDCSSPLGALVLGPVLAAQQELPEISCRSIDLTGTDAKVLAAELDADDPVIALRQGLRWAPMYQRIQLPSPSYGRLRSRGVYLITGAFGGIGTALSDYLAETVQARLVLMSRTPPTDSDLRIRRIEELGGTAIIAAADVSEPAQVQNVVAAARKRFGALHGVIHCAGIAGGGLIALRSREDALRVLRPKVQGTLALFSACESESLDFFLLCSSLTTAVGGFGQSDYIAANAFMDAFAQHATSRGVPVTAIDWDTWRDAGMAVEASAPEILRQLWQPALERGIASAEGKSIFSRVLGCSLPRVLVSTSSIAERMDELKRAPAEALRAVQEEKRAHRRHPRPNIATPYVAPVSDFEARICDIWEENLGFERIGLDDDYFELGGDSLTAVSLVNQIQAWVGETVHVTAVFEESTPRRLAAYLQQNYTAQTQAAEPVLTVSDITEFRQKLPHLRERVNPRGPRNQRAAFLLSAPRTGSTLLRAMLAGHPGIFAPPELALLSFNTLGERRQSVPDDGAGLLDGPIHAIDAATGCGLSEAARTFAAWESEDLSVKDCYARLQEMIAGRVLVDKTPHYALDRATIERAETDFHDPLYLLLVRHPYGMIHSYVEGKMDLLLSRSLREQSRFSRRQLAELIWSESYRNLRDFSQNHPRCLWIRFEELVTEPETVMERICAFLGLEAHPATLKPYSEPEKRMTSGPKQGARMLGDPKFHSFSKIESDVAERWREKTNQDYLSQASQELAEWFGYNLLSKPMTRHGGGVDELTDAEVEAALAVELARYQKETS